jgi:hypothetical protein
LIGIVAVGSNANSVWPYLFSLNRIEIFLVLPENESRRQTVAYHLADSVAFAQKNEL